MSVFPRLRSGALVQVPILKTNTSPQGRVEFWGGGRQTFPRQRNGSDEWLLRYTGLSDSEAYTLLDFCEQRAQDQAYFDFEDPLTGVVNTRCVVDAQSLSVRELAEEGREFVVRIKSVQE